MTRKNITPDPTARNRAAKPKAGGKATFPEIEKRLADLTAEAFNRYEAHLTAIMTTPGLSPESQEKLLLSAVDLFKEINLSAAMTAIAVRKRYATAASQVATEGKIQKAEGWQSIAKRLAAPHLAPGAGKKTPRSIVRMVRFWDNFVAECKARGITPPARDTVRRALSP